MKKMRLTMAIKKEQVLKYMQSRPDETVFTPTLIGQAVFGLTTVYAFSWALPVLESLFADGKLIKKKSGQYSLKSEHSKPK